MDAKDLHLFEAGLGNVTWWGYSPSFNILENMDPAESDEVNVLLLGSADGRHFIEAMSGSDPAPESFKELTFWILEQNLMTMARQMLFITILYDTEITDSQEKAKIILEIMGNTELRTSTFKYLIKKSEELRQTAVHEANKEEGEENKLSSKWIEVDMSWLRYKDLDLLEGIFKFWKSEGREAMNVKLSFGVRLKQIAQGRDNLAGLADLDYQMRLVPRGGGCVSNLEYQEFRAAGKAYDFYSEADEGQLHLPNNTFVSSLVTHKDGERLSRRGYWGDVITGPFITYGHNYKTDVDMNTTKTARTSQEIALKRVEALASQIQAKITTMVPEKRVRVRFLPTNTDRDLLETYDAEDETLFVERCKQKFDRVFIGCSVTHLLTKGLLVCLKPKKVSVYVETSLYLLHIADPIQVKYKEHLQSFVSKNNGELAEKDYDPMAKSYILLTFS